MPNVRVIYWSMRVMAYGRADVPGRRVGAWLYGRELERPAGSRPIVAIAFPTSPTAGWILTEMGASLDRQGC
jgi:hypothetical protein